MEVRSSRGASCAYAKETASSAAPASEINCFNRFIFTPQTGRCTAGSPRPDCRFEARACKFDGHEMVRKRPPLEHHRRSVVYIRDAGATIGETNEIQHENELGVRGCERVPSCARVSSNWAGWRLGWSRFAGWWSWRNYGWSERGWRGRPGRGTYRWRWKRCRHYRRRRSDAFDGPSHQSRLCCNRCRPNSRKQRPGQR